MGQDQSERAASARTMMTGTQDSNCLFQVFQIILFVYLFSFLVKSPYFNMTEAVIIWR